MLELLYKYIKKTAISICDQLEAADAGSHDFLKAAASKREGAHGRRHRAAAQAKQEGAHGRRYMAAAQAKQEVAHGRRHRAVTWSKREAAHGSYNKAAAMSKREAAHGRRHRAVAQETGADSAWNRSSKRSKMMNRKINLN